MVPGMMPARNRRPTDSSISAPSMTKMMDGGMIGPTVAAEAITALENAAGNPFFFISGSNTVPVAAASAMADPDMPDMM